MTADLAAPAQPALPLAGDRPTDRQRPPANETIAVQAVAALVSDDGTRTPLDRAYVFGREPQNDSLVTGGQATPIVVRDPDNLVSRVQVYLFVDGGAVTVRDVESANGTFVAAPGAPDWVRLGEAPAALPVGWSMRMGRRVFTHTGPST